MGLFSKKKPTPEPPVRRDQVLRLIKLGMEETDAADRDIDEIDSPLFNAAKARMDAELNRSTQAEINAAYDALKRHGY
ncbi:hypothetical protein [Sphaerimonospora mesophila]|uniref:hypothetical protein n=1 Tax=Sphaerimonospora mesophila TaxID=37483 RepID=UPI0006E46D32